MNKNLPYGMIIASFIFGAGSLALFLAFLLIGSFNLVQFNISTIQALLLDLGLSLIFFIQHSIMARKGARDILTEFIPDVYYNAFYSVISGVTLILVLILWQGAPRIIAGTSGIYYWMMRLMFVMAIAGFAWGANSLGALDPFGVRDIKRHLKNSKPKPLPFMMKGAYRLVRHPFYLFSILMIWACPELTADRLLFNILWSAWICIGAVLEEGNLVLEFGEQYLDYQSKVPMIIPFRLSCTADDKGR
ncbi:MAG: isoprenylcysteine carboxylmethyltransferase family protein [Deltaproteobacteria bacterium]|nr:isoprenylcysteine carboxylmethyltransferase family protein [Deltaproteobacteria bacterium]